MYNLVAFKIKELFFMFVKFTDHFILNILSLLIHMLLKFILIFYDSAEFNLDELVQFCKHHRHNQFDHLIDFELNHLVQILLLFIIQFIILSFVLFQFSFLIFCGLNIVFFEIIRKTERSK